MKIDFSQPLMALNPGQPLTQGENGPPLMLGAVCLQALLAPSDDIAGDEKVRRFRIAMTLSTAFRAADELVTAAVKRVHQQEHEDKQALGAAVLAAVELLEIPPAEAELTAEEIASIKAVVGKTWGSPLVVGRAYELLEGGAPETKH